MNELILKNLDVGVIGTGCTYLDFATGNLANLTATPITPNDAAVDLAVASVNAANILAVTLIPNALNTLPDYISNAAGAVYLPVCTKGTHVALTLLGDMDEAYRQLTSLSGEKTQDERTALSGASARSKQKRDDFVEAYRKPLGKF